jgi:hypothetical protein
MSATRPYSQDASLREKARVLKQDIDALRRAVSPEMGGRDPTNLYPRLPAGPWSGADLVGLEPPLAVSERRRR